MFLVLTRTAREELSAWCCSKPVYTSDRDFHLVTNILHAENGNNMYMGIKYLLESLQKVTLKSEKHDMMCNISFLPAGTCTVNSAGGCMCNLMIQVSYGVVTDNLKLKKKEAINSFTAGKMPSKAKNLMRGGSWGSLPLADPIHIHVFVGLTGLYGVENLLRFQRDRFASLGSEGVKLVKSSILSVSVVGSYIVDPIEQDNLK